MRKAADERANGKRADRSQKDGAIAELFIHIGWKGRYDSDDQRVTGGQPLRKCQWNVHFLLDDRKSCDHHRLAGQTDERWKKQQHGNCRPKFRIDGFWNICHVFNSSF